MLLYIMCGMYINISIDSCIHDQASKNKCREKIHNNGPNKLFKENFLCIKRPYLTLKQSFSSLVTVNHLLFASVLIFNDICADISQM